jgi:hypothetical protein
MNGYITGTHISLPASTSIVSQNWDYNKMASNATSTLMMLHQANVRALSIAGPYWTPFMTSFPCFPGFLWIG